MTAATTAVEPSQDFADAAPETLPLPVCWALWAASSAGLWYAILSIAEVFAG